MALHKRSGAAKMPFPGESPTIALALAAGDKYGVHPVEEAPAKGGKKVSAAKPKRKAKPKAKSTSR